MRVFNQCACFFHLKITFSKILLGRSLMIGWRKKSWNPENVSSVFTFVSFCPSVCLSPSYRAHLLTYELNFLTEGSLGHENETHFFLVSDFENSIFTAKGVIFSMFFLSFDPKIKFIGQKVCSVACMQTHRQTDRHESENRGHPFMVSGIFPFAYHQGPVQ